MNLSPDLAFKTLTRSAGIAVVCVLGFVTAFLLAEAWPAITAGSDLDAGGQNVWQYVAPFAFGTIWVAALALLFATPIAIGIALFTTHYAGPRLSRWLGFTIDLLAAIPSVVFGLWGIQVLAPALQPVYQWLSSTFGWVPLFRGPASGTGRTVLTVALVVALMILPIIAAVSREVFQRVPSSQQEAILALGATRWEMIRIVALPYARRGIVSAMMLGLGRALGETMVVAMVLSPAAVISFALLTTQNPNTVAANIALNFPEAFGLKVNLLIATGLVLFAVTFAVNAAARWVTKREPAAQGVKA